MAPNTKRIGCKPAYPAKQFYSILSFVFWMSGKLSALCFPVCPEPPNVTAIIGASIASVALIGLLLLMIIKLLIYMKDLKEFRKFEKEKKKSKWTDVSLLLLLYHHFGAQQPTDPQSSSVARQITRCSKMQPPPSPTPPSLENNISVVISTFIDIFRVLMTNDTLLPKQMPLSCLHVSENISFGL